jgi:DNA-binding PadR family transcriptional regulator
VLRYIIYVEMCSGIMLIATFRQTGVHEMLILLLKEEMKISEITKTIHSQSAYRSISLLKELGLIGVRRGEYNKKFYCLTAKGKKVATKLKEIEEILNSE